MSTKEERERLYKILNMSGLRKGEFIKKLDILHQSLNSYLKGDNDFQVITRKLSFLGFSIDWLYTGKGNPTFQPDVFIENFGVLNVHDEDKQKLRIVNWIIKHYTSISEFEIDRSINPGELESVLLGDEVLTHDLLVKLDNAGINIKWTIDGRGSMYNSKSIGIKLSKRLKNEN